MGLVKHPVGVLSSEGPGFSFLQRKAAGMLRAARMQGLAAVERLQNVCSVSMLAPDSLRKVELAHCRRFAVEITS